ncbi:ribonuclease H2 subunit C-like isoform X1 [Argonauta hians]
MAVYVDLSKWHEAELADRCHYMPCVIKYSGETNSKKYFESGIQQSEDGKEFQASFRGRPLNGKSMSPPPGYEGMIIKEKKVPLTEEDDRQFSVVARVPKFTYWNLDKPVTDEDKLSKALIFTEIAHELHHREEEDMEKEEEDGNESKEDEAT